MRDIDPVLAERLASGTTALARCWILRRTDGVALGFTEHDRPLAVSGVTCSPTAGMEPADASSQLGFAVGGGGGGRSAGRSEPHRSRPGGWPI